jgi:hypothetical protein
MFRKNTGRNRGHTFWKGALIVFVLAVGPCPNVQYPPGNTELFWGVAIATGQDLSAPAEMVQGDALLLPESVGVSTDTGLTCERTGVGDRCSAGFLSDKEDGLRDARSRRSH